MKKALISLALTGLMVPLSSQAAWDGLLDLARQKIDDLQSGRSAKTAPVRATGAVDNWGGDAPFRGDESHGKTPANHGQHSDERDIDDRFLNNRRERAEPVAAPVAAPAPAQPAARRTRPATTPSAQPVATPVDSAPAPAARAVQRQDAGSCTNVQRAWDGASRLASTGKEAQAYAAYLRLLSSCTQEAELTGTLFQAQKNLSPSSMTTLLAEPVLSSQALEGPVSSIRVQQMFAANKAGQGAEALALSRESRSWLLQHPDAGALEVSGWLEQRAGKPAEAESLFRAALKADAASATARQGLVYALLAQTKVDAAGREAGALTGADADVVRGEVLLAQSRQALSQKRYEKAISLLEEAERSGLAIDDSVTETRAWAMKGQGRHAEAAELFRELARNAPQHQGFARATVESLAASRQYGVVRELRKEGGELGRAADVATADYLEARGQRRDAAEIRGEKAEGYAGGVRAGVLARTKSGDTGEGRLTETRVPVLDVTVPVGSRSAIIASAERVNMSDGRNDVQGEELRVGVTTQVGDMAVTATGGVSQVAGDAKTVGEVDVKSFYEAGFMGIRVSHLPVTDSVRSYAGVGSGASRTHRVMDTQATLYGTAGVGDSGAYSVDWAVSAGSTRGATSYNNGYYRATAALMREYQNERLAWMNAGPFITVGSYERDENRFEGTYGGYFSPKSDVSAGIRANAMTLEGGQSLHKVSGAIGYVTRGLHYGNDAGASVELTTQSVWVLSPHLIAGASVGLRVSPGYSDVAVKLGLAIPFEKRTKAYASDLQGFSVR